MTADQTPRDVMAQAMAVATGYDIVHCEALADESLAALTEHGYQITKAQKCPDCAGRGVKPYTWLDEVDQSHTFSERCAACKGTGTIIAAAQPTDAGDGA